MGACPEKKRGHKNNNSLRAVQKLKKLSKSLSKTENNIWYTKNIRTTRFPDCPKCVSKNAVQKKSDTLYSPTRRPVFSGESWKKLILFRIPRTRRNGLKEEIFCSFFHIYKVIPLKTCSTANCKFFFFVFFSCAFFCMILCSGVSEKERKILCFIFFEFLVFLEFERPKQIFWTVIFLVDIFLKNIIAEKMVYVWYSMR